MGCGRTTAGANGERTTERIGLQGPIGCGKTSVLRFALDDSDTEIAPIWVSVAFDDDDVVLDVRRFAAHLIQSVVRDAQRAWIRYRDAFLAFAAIKYPQVPKESLAAWITRQRTEMWKSDE